MKNVIIAIVIGLAVLSPFNLTNSYLRCSEFDKVVVQHGESVENIASRYTDDIKGIKELSEAIVEINDIKSSHDLRAGRVLQVPVMHRADDSLQMAVADGDGMN
ncbi:LysM peptidoglycan-binding domain-containing protein [Anaerovibrio sp.]|uniref:LysM peptidoglycan-binding domain-containing protein n=1 Tax=Anaerovibrio sp. TaxID=1872532 RepID=UPI001B437FA6|nr:LysM peptidoglycan-binding domain-containing protein [Anaerovibrio sp.]MBP3232249.1 LysM peptidoglycan-binding domain-containing protein [Anaerovibrio sp.]MBR2143695.1 LysM peptidoglycan-binding domain-containing protein [Anaerovibrio sp.]